MIRGSQKAELEPVDIPLMYPRIDDDAQGADGGIGRLHVTRDLVVYVTYRFPTPVGTTFQMFWGGSVPIAFHLVRDGDPPRTRFPLTVRADLIKEYWADPVYCRVIPSDEPPQQTQPLRLRVNLGRPGGKAPEPTEDGNRKLILELEPEVALEGVSEQKAKEGVALTCHKWENMSVYDLLTVYWGSQRVEHLVQENEVDKDIHLMITPEVISAAGDSEMLPVAMTVMGNTGNLPDENAPRSVITRVEVHAGTRRMDSPWVDFPSTDSTINLAEIGNDAVRMGLYVTAADGEHYTHAHFYWIGTRADEGSVVHSETRELVSGGRAYYFEVPNAIAAEIAKGKALAYFTLDGPDGPSVRSNYRYLTVVGEIRQWESPSVEGEEDGQIKPDLPEVTIHIPIQKVWQSFEMLELKLLASNADGTIESNTGILLGDVPPDAEQLTVVLGGDELQKFKGRNIELFYSAIKEGERPRESLRRLLRVGELEADMPAAIVQDEQDGVLYLDSVSPFGTPIDAPFEKVEFGDWITLCIKGVHSVDLPKQANIPGVPMRFDVLPRDLEPNRDTDTSIYYTLKRGNLPERYSATTPLHIA